MEGVGHPQRSLLPLARERQWSDRGLCPERPYYHLNQILDERMMGALCLNHWDEFIYQTTYEIDIRKYDHYKEDLKAFSNNAEEILLQVVTMCAWVREYHQKTQRMPDSYLPYMLWSQGSRHGEWHVPEIDDLKNSEYRDKCKERWKYLVILLQFWIDNNVTVHIRGGPVRPMSALAKLVKDMPNYVLPTGFRISWKHVV